MGLSSEGPKKRPVLVWLEVTDVWEALEEERVERLRGDGGSGDAPSDVYSKESVSDASNSKEDSLESPQHGSYKKLPGRECGAAARFIFAKEMICSTTSG